MKNLILGLAFVLLACTKASTPPPAAPEPAPTPVEQQPSAETPVCETDADCVVSRSKPNECCDQLCPPWEQVYHKDVAAQIEAWKGPNCAAVSCPVAKCIAPTEEAVGKCQAGGCVIEKRPITNP